MYNTYGTTTYNGMLIQDITKRYIIGATNRNRDVPIFMDYLIKDWEAPEEIAHKLYGSCDYEWVILLANNIINPYTDWLLTNYELEQYIKNKYGSKAKDIHHYELNGIIYYEPVLGSNPITNSEYEYDKNEKKRLINVVYPELLYQIQESLSRV